MTELIEKVKDEGSSVGVFPVSDGFILLLKVPIEL
jgi:hypothetical protein